MVGSEIKWDMKKRTDRLDELRKKYPELDRAVKITGLFIKINTVWTNDDDIETAFEELEDILELRETGERNEPDADCDYIGKFKKFIEDMKRAGIKYDEEYHGRFFYIGPAVRTKEKGFPTKDDVIRSTKVKLQWDNLGLDYIVYPE